MERPRAGAETRGRGRLWVQEVELEAEAEAMVVVLGPRSVLLPSADRKRRGSFKSNSYLCRVCGADR